MIYLLIAAAAALGVIAVCIAEARRDITANGRDLGSLLADVQPDHDDERQRRQP